MATRETVSAPGCVGRVNLGATDYLNAVVQFLFHIPAFRSIVYQIPTAGEDAANSIPLSLQRLFCRMQLGSAACSTRELTRSFGWGDGDISVQHDAQEFCRVLTDNLEAKLRNTALDGRIAGLFRGRTRSYIRCTNVNYESGREEQFYDLLLKVRGCADLAAAFEEYTGTEALDGENQYTTDDFGPQDAVMGVEFVEFPRILQIFLRRFDFDMETFEMAKVNDRFEFPKVIDLGRFLAAAADRSASTQYDLCGVVVHAGSADFGSYSAFLRISAEQQWFQFKDDVVTRATEEDAVQANFGGKNGTAAADLLVYVRRDAMADIFQPIPEEAIPDLVRRANQ